MCCQFARTSYVEKLQSLSPRGGTDVLKITTKWKTEFKCYVKGSSTNLARLDVGYGLHCLSQSGNGICQGHAHNCTSFEKGKTQGKFIRRSVSKFQASRSMPSHRWAGHLESAQISESPFKYPLGKKL